MSKNLKIAGLAIVLAAGLLATLAWTLWFRHSSSAREELLSLMPATSQSVLYFDLREIHQAPFFSELLSWAPKPDADAEYRQFVRDTGFNYETDLDRLTVAFEKHGSQEIFFGVADGRFDPAKIKAYTLKAGATQNANDAAVLSMPAAGRASRVTFKFLRNDRVAFTNGSDLAALLASTTSNDRAEWQSRFTRLAGSPVFAVISKDGLRNMFAADSGVQEMAPRVPGGFSSPQLATLLQQLQWLTIAVKPENDRLKIVAEGESLEDTSARQLADLLNGVVLLARAGLGSTRIDAATRESYLTLLRSVQVSRIDRADTKSVRLMFDVTPQLLKSARQSTPALTPGRLPQ
jgi:hypothetical protein